jgi:hypothetical protein
MSRAASCHDDVAGEWLVQLEEQSGQRHDWADVVHLAMEGAVAAKSVLFGKVSRCIKRDGRDQIVQVPLAPFLMGDLRRIWSSHTGKLHRGKGMVHSVDVGLVA